MSGWRYLFHRCGFHVWQVNRVEGYSYQRKCKICERKQKKTFDFFREQYGKWTWIS